MVPPRSPTLQRGGQNPKWPGNGPGGYIAPAAQGFPNAPQRGTKFEVAGKWPCRLVGPQHFRAEGKIRSGPQVGRVAT